jgi:heat shock protein HtpX
MMWELISENRKKSMTLFVGMAVLLVLLGFFIGEAFSPDGGGLYGLVFAVGLWIALTLISLNSGDSILLHVAGAKEITRDVHPRLFNVVEEMKIASGLPAMPKIYIIDEPAPNAFAIGVKPDKSAVAVTAGLLERLNRDELQGVIAHEVAHISNRDSQLMTTAGIMLGSIVLLSHFFLRSWFYMGAGGSKRYRKGSGGSPQLQLIMIAVAVVLAILGPIFARLLYLAISRKREYLADATAVQLTRYPDGLASALEKISGLDIPLESANQVTAPMYIVSPLFRKGNKLSRLDSTHPPIQERVTILRAMSAGADWAAYQKAYSKLKGKPTPLISPSALRKSEHVDIRQPSAETEAPKSEKKTARDVMDLLRGVNEYAFLACVCGLRMKLPPEMAPDSKVSCPRCGRENELPVAEMATIGAVVEAAVGAGDGADSASSTSSTSSSETSPARMEYVRKGKGWETFACQCGRLLQLSPAFEGSQMVCRSCSRAILIKN